MDRWQLRPATYRTICVVAMSLVCLAVVTGAAVRLTGSGLGCDDWPRCSDSKVVDVSTGHAAIEQINRLLTGLISLVVIAAVLAARWRAPRRRDLTVLSYGLVAGVLGQPVTEGEDGGREVAGDDGGLSPLGIIRRRRRRHGADEEQAQHGSPSQS